MLGPRTCAHSVRISPLPLLGLLSLLGSLAACSGASPTQGAPATRADVGPPPPTSPLRPGEGQVLLSYRMPDGSWASTQTVAEVPAEARAQVLVVNLELSPERRASDRWVQVADLRQPGPDGAFAVQAVLRSEWEQRQQARYVGAGVPAQAPGALPQISGQPQLPGQPSPRGPRPRAPHPPAGASAASDGGGKLVMYSTRYCPACKEARRFLKALKVPFTDKDVEADPAAARELEQTARRAGLRGNGVPVFVYRGKVVGGFHKQRLLALLRGT